MVTRQELINTKRDARDLGKAANEKVIVSPRYGEDFKSIPLIVMEGEAKINQAAQTITSATASIVSQKNQASEVISQAESDVATAAADVHQRGNQEIINLQNAIDIAAAAGAGKNGWTAQLIVDASGKNQQEINDYNGAEWRNKVAGYKLNSRVMLDNGSIVRSIVANNTVDPNLDMTGWVRGSTVKLSDLGAKPDPDFDSAIAWLAINDALSDGDTLIIDIDNYVSSYVEVTKQINIDNRATTYLNTGVNNALIVFSAPLSRTISGSALSVLPKKGDNKLHFTALDFNPTDYLVILESTEITTVRVGQTNSYTKQEINELVTNGCILRDTVLHDYTDASKLQIKLIKKTQQNTYTNFKVKLFNSVGATRKDGCVEFRRLYGKTIVNLQVSKEGSEHVRGSGVKFSDCAEFTWIAPTLSRFNNVDEDPSYPFFNIRSGFMLFIKPVYTDGGNEFRKERGYAGRHGRNIVFIMPQLGGIDDHWGHNYIIEKATFTTRGVGIAGGSLTLRDCSSFGAPLVALRGDTPYADGTLTLDNCSSDHALIYSSHVAVDEQPTTYKHWDKVRIINSKPCTTKSEGGIPMVAISCNDPSQVNTVLKTDLEIDTLEFKNGTPVENSSLIRFSRGQSWLRKLTLKNIKDTTIVEPTQFRPLIKSVECEVLEVSDCENFTWSFVTAGDFTIKGGTVGNNSDGDVNFTITRMGRFSTDFSSKLAGPLILQASSTAKLFFTSCIFDTLKVFESTTVQNRIEFMSGNIVGSSLSTFNSPVDIYHYVKPTAHKQRYGTVSIITRTIDSNSASESYPITISGAKLGDVVDVSPSGSLNGCDVIAYVTADDTVRYQINNNSKYTAAIPTQTLTFRVRSI